MRVDKRDNRRSASRGVRDERESRERDSREGMRVEKRV